MRGGGWQVWSDYEAPLRKKGGEGKGIRKGRVTNGALPPPPPPPLPPSWWHADAIQQYASGSGHGGGSQRFNGYFVPHRLCNHFEMHGWCQKADACTFAHGVNELHPDAQNSRSYHNSSRGRPGGTSSGNWKGTASKGNHKEQNSTYVDEMYTTKLDPKGITMEKRLEADRIAREIESKRKSSTPSGSLQKGGYRGRGGRGDGKGNGFGGVRGVPSDYKSSYSYDEELYTTNLDIGSISREKREEADRIAREIVREIEASRKANEAKAKSEAQDTEADKSGGGADGGKHASPDDVPAASADETTAAKDQGSVEEQAPQDTVEDASTEVASVAPPEIVSEAPKEVVLETTKEGESEAPTIDKETKTEEGAPGASETSPNAIEESTEAKD